MRAIIVVGMLAATAHATPRDFTPEVKQLYASVACGDGAKSVHCAEVEKSIASWRTRWRDKVQPFVAAHVASPPTTVVYPFGGGDLATALAVYPDATDYTTLSLEGMGDPRSAAHPTATQLAKFRAVLVANLGWAWNTTTQLSIDSSETGAGIPGILALTMTALAANGYEPVSARFFTLGRDGAIAYVGDDELRAWDARPLARPTHKADNSLQVGLFSDVEIRFRKLGDPAAPVKTFRHLAADLSDDGTAAAIAFVAARPSFAVVTKAASYLLWKPTFAQLRATLLAHMAVMVSDDTGIPPHLAVGFVQDVWGSYHGAFFDWADKVTAREFAAYWKAHTQGPLDFRFGYYDDKRQPHLMITHK